MVKPILREFHNCISRINKGFAYVIALYCTDIFNIGIGQ